MKGFAIGSGVAIALLLSAIGFVMVGPGGGNAYPWPLRVSLAAVVLLPIGWRAMVQTPAPWKLGLALALVMLAILLLLALPFMDPGWMRETHGGVFAVWATLWFVAALPFMRSATRRIG
ncbi:hypothetical protein [Paraurantiacibacter namhicola]|uniref:Transmembrane protein n=1 Tax=Paraurantiacibacter namhicola TaxID=645517 RepID=A0A1C7D4E4_9SPHN|nr:hypothetical protein [Paraurantiacibacter namhicola]ANU06335.1 hypothetical protein A6F65_00007 [Paraurantiacibacter namhicola]